MAEKRPSLRDRQRKNMMYAYRAREQRNNNLWLVYSYKTNRDWILPSDRQLIHWIHYLEINPKVKSFTLTPEPVYGHDGVRERTTELDAEVTYVNNTVEWHEVKAGVEIVQTSQIAAQQNAAARAGRTYRVFTDLDLSPHVKTSVRWLKAIGYAAAIRGREYIPSRLALLSFVMERHRGTVGLIHEELQGHDPSVITGLLVRLAIEGHISLDLVLAGLGRSTPWHCYISED